MRLSGSPCLPVSQDTTPSLFFSRDLLSVALRRSRSIISTFCPLRAILAAIFIVMNVLPALGLKDVTIITWFPSSFPIIMSRFVRSTRKASLITFRLPFLTTIRQFRLSNLCRPMLAMFRFRDDFICGISDRKGMLRTERSFFPLTVLSIILPRKIIPNGMPPPSTRATSRIIIRFGDIGPGAPVGDTISRVLATFTRLAISFSSRFCKR